jgi:hypothetical protein
VLAQPDLKTQFLRKALMTRVPRYQLPLSGGPCQENVRRMSGECQQKPTRSKKVIDEQNENF